MVTLEPPHEEAKILGLEASWATTKFQVLEGFSVKENGLFKCVVRTVRS